MLRRLRSAISDDVIDLFASQLIAVSASMLLTLFTASTLGAHGRGVFALVIGTANLIAQAVSFSLHVGAANAYRSGDGGAIRHQLKVAALLALAVLVVGVPISLALPQGTTLGPVEGVLICVLAAVLLIQSFATGTIQGVGLAAVYRRLVTINALLGLALGLISALLTRSPTPVLLSWAAASVVTSLAALPVLRRLSQDGGTTIPVRSVLTDAAAAHVGSLGQQLLFRADIPILGAFAPIREVGLYSVASPVANVVFLLAQTASMATFGVGREGNSLPAHETRLRRILGIYLAVAIPTALLLMAGGAWLIPRLLPEFTQTPLLIALLVPGTVVQGVARIGLASLFARSDQRSSMIVGIGSALLSLAYFPAIIGAGAVGAAVASSAIYCAQAALVGLVLRRTRTPVVSADE